MTSLRRRLRSLDPALLAHPVFVAFLALLALYGWQAWRRDLPWLFTDELEWSVLARSVAEDGELTRRGEPYPRIAFYPYVLAPAWLLDTASAYAWSKWIGTAFMTATIFPAYLLGRMLLTRPYAFAAAVGSVTVPALIYTSFIVEETVAYFWSALTLWLVVRALASRRRRDVAVAVVVALVATGVRDQLVVLPAVFALAAAWLAWTSGAVRSRRSSWTRADWFGFAVLALGAVVVANAWASHQSYAWELATRLYKTRLLEYSLWAAGALAIGIGVLPFVGGLAAVWRPRLARVTPAERAFWPVFIAGLAAFGFYAGVKGTYLSLTFTTRVVERNLIYLVPLLLIATAVLVERRSVRLPALAAASAVTLFVVVNTPYQMESHLYSDAPGLAILSWANRHYGWTPEKAQIVLLWMLVASVAVLLLQLVDRGWLRRAGTAVAALAAVGTVAWGLTGQITGANAAIAFSDRYMESLPRPFDWVDRHTDGEPALFIGQRIDDPNGIHYLEFWNRSIKAVWSMDGTGPGPGPSLSPNITTRRGTLSHSPGYDWVVAEEEIELVGEVVDRVAGWRLYRIDKPLRVEHSVTGIATDGWVGSAHEAETVRATYSRYSTPGERAGTALVRVSREAWGGASRPADVEIRLGPLELNDNLQPVIGTVTARRSWVVDSRLARTFRIPTPPPPFHVEVDIGPTFVPALVEPGHPEHRYLGAQVSFSFSEAP